MADLTSIETIHGFYLQRLRERHAQTARVGHPAWLAARLFFWSRRVRPAIGETIRHLRSRPIRPSSIVDAIRFGIWAGEHPESHRAKQKFGLADRWDRRREFFYHEEACRVLADLADRVASDDHDDLKDKIATVRRLAAAGLPTVDSLAEYKDGNPVNEAIDAREWQVDLITKPVALYQGHGVELWEYRQGRHHSDGRSFYLDGFKKYLCDLSREQAIVVQARLKNHPAIEGISGRALSTVRLMTIKQPDGDPQIAESVFRMATGDSIADNFALGGIAAPIDLETGTLGAAATKTSIDAPSLLSHPDTGCPIQGVVLPCWEESKKLAQAAHQEFKAMPAVGWDVALTDCGPVVIEGNGVWCVDLVQMAHRKAFARMKLADALANHIRHI